MNPKRSKVGGLIVLCAAASLLLAGCGTPHAQPVPWTLSITKKVPSSIEVDLIPVNAASKGTWENYPPSQYWQAGDAQRSQTTDKKTLYLQQDQPDVVAKNDAVWKDWLNRGAVYVLIMAHLDPNVLKVNPAAGRVFVPLDKNAWMSKDGKIQVEVRDTMVEVITPMNQAH